MSEDYRHLRADRLIESADKLAARVVERFPQAGLGQVACVIADVARNAIDRAEQIRRPNWWLRGGLIALAAVVVLGGVIAVVVTLNEQERGLARLLTFLQQGAGAAAFLSAGVVFLVTLETRLKRSRAVQAIHELRALAHIIDMHQLNKAPDVKTEGRPTYTIEELYRYLQSCTEMLAMISKIGQLYVQDFPDGTTLSAVDQFENLATGLSQKIWQKIMILDRIIADAEEEKMERG